MLLRFSNVTGAVIFYLWACGRVMEIKMGIYVYKAFIHFLSTTP